MAQTIYLGFDKLTCRGCGRKFSRNELHLNGYCWGCVQREAWLDCPHCREKDAEIERLRVLVQSLAERVAAQSELLTRRAEG